jgi:hypothetical protein
MLRTTGRVHRMYLIQCGYKNQCDIYQFLSFCCYNVHVRYRVTWVYVTPWTSYVSQFIKKFPAFYGTCQWSLHGPFWYQALIKAWISFLQLLRQKLRLPFLPLMLVPGFDYPDNIWHKLKRPALYSNWRGERIWSLRTACSQVPSPDYLHVCYQSPLCSYSAADPTSAWYSYC